MSRVRVAYVTAFLRPGGAERQMLALAERLPGDRFEVEFVVLAGRGEYDARAIAAGARVRTIGGAPSGHGPPQVRLGSRMSKVLRYARIVRAARYDVVDAWLYPADLLAALLRPLTRVPAVVAGRRNVDPRTALGPLERLVGRAALRMTDVVVANSAAAAAHAIAVEGIDPRKIRVIRNGVLLPPPTEPAEREARRQSLGIGPDEIAIGCVANFLPVKRHDLLLAAFARLVACGLTARLVLVGDGPLRAAIEHQVRQLALADAVLLAGQILDPTPLYAAFDIVAQASAREGLPNAMLEGGAAARPLVATEAGGSGEIVLDGRTGLLVPRGDVGALADALARLVVDRDLRERLGVAARSHVAASFGMDRFVSEFAELYDGLAARRRR